MNEEDVILMAREAGSIDSEDVIKTVYAAFAAAEREACAVIAEQYEEGSGGADAIRARSKV